MLMELLFWRKPPGRPQCFFFSHYKFGKVFVVRITSSHPCLAKMNKNVTEQLTSHTVSVLISLRFGLWTLVPRARAALFEYMQSVCVLENITFCSLFTNCLRPFRDFSHHTVTSNNHHLFPLLVGDMRCRCSSKQSLAVGACNDFCICSFKCFHTADMFAALAHPSVWSRHVIVQYNLFGLFAYSERAFFLLLFSAE